MLSIIEAIEPRITTPPIIVWLYMCRFLLPCWRLEASVDKSQNIRLLLEGEMDCVSLERESKSWRFDVNNINVRCINSLTKLRRRRFNAGTRIILPLRSIK